MDLLFAISVITDYKRMSSRSTSRGSMDARFRVEFTCVAR